MAINYEEVGELVDRVVHINRVAKVVKGGRRFSFSALVVVGDQHGHVGAGLGKANEVPEAIRKGTEQAKKNLFKIPLDRRHHPARGAGPLRRRRRCCSRPASAGTGVIAGGAVRPVLEVAGIQRHPDQVHRHVEPAQRHPRDRSTRSSSCAAPTRSRAAARQDARRDARRVRDDHGASQAATSTLSSRAASTAPSSAEADHPQGLGLSSCGVAQVVVLDNTPSIRGMIREGLAPRDGRGEPMEQ